MGGCFIQVQVLKDVAADAIPGGDGRGETPEQALRRELLEAMEQLLEGVPLSHHGVISRAYSNDQHDC